MGEALYSMNYEPQATQYRGEAARHHIVFWAPLQIPPARLDTIIGAVVRGEQLLGRSLLQLKLTKFEEKVRRFPIVGDRALYTLTWYSYATLGQPPTEIGVLNQVVNLLGSYNLLVVTKKVERGRWPVFPKIVLAGIPLLLGLGVLAVVLIRRRR